MPAQKTLSRRAALTAARRFTGELIAGGVERHRGFKCPHCKLFVPESRVEDAPLGGDSN